MLINIISKEVLIPETNKFFPKIPEVPKQTSEPVSQIVPDYLTSRTRIENGKYDLGTNF